MKQKIGGTILFLTMLCSLSLTIFQRSNAESGRLFVMISPPNGSDTAFFRANFVEKKPLVAQVHAATAAPIAGGLLAVWYGGSREGAKDVKLYQARYQNSWSHAKPIMDCAIAAEQLGIYVRKIGNPLLHRDPSGRLWLFFVTVSHGGWAGSQINYMSSDDDGEHWSNANILVTSPFVNISTLVKGRPITLSKHVIGLPIYHEFVAKFGEFLRVSFEGKVLHKARLSHVQGTIQPSLAVHSAKEATAYLRASGTSKKRIYRAITQDGGVSWQPQAEMKLANPDAAIATLKLSNGSTLIAFNNSESERENLMLATDGDGWNYTVEETTDSKKMPEFSYPYLVRDDHGDIHLLYTWHRTHIKHLIFNEAWLQSQGS